MPGSIVKLGKSLHKGWQLVGIDYQITGEKAAARAIIAGKIMVFLATTDAVTGMELVRIDMIFREESIIGGRSTAIGHSKVVVALAVSRNQLQFVVVF